MSSQRASLFFFFFSPYENSIGHNLLRIHMHILSAVLKQQACRAFFYGSPSLSRLNEGECVRGTVKQSGNRWHNLGLKQSKHKSE